MMPEEVKDHPEPTISTHRPSRPAEDRPPGGPPTRGDRSRESVGSKRDVVEQNKRRQKTAYKNQHFTKAGDSHKSKSGKRKPVGRTEECESSSSEEEDEGVEEIVPEPEPELPLLDSTPVRIPSQRQTLERASHTLFKKCYFFFAQHFLVYLAQYIFDSTELTFVNSPVMLVLAYFGAMRYLTVLDSVVFLMWLPHSPEFRHFRSCVSKRDFSTIVYGFDSETIGGIIGVASIFNMAPGSLKLKCMYTTLIACTFLLYDAFSFVGVVNQPILHGETRAAICERPDVESWSYLGGSTSYYDARISQQLNVILINEFATSCARVKGTSDRMLYAAIEHAKKFRYDDDREKYQIVVNTVKYSTQELIATQLSMVTDGGLAARPLVLPIR